MHRWSSRFRLTATVLFLAVSGLCLVLLPSLAVFGQAPQPQNVPAALAKCQQCHGDTVQMSHLDRKSTRLNSSHEWISYAVFCLKKKKKKNYLIHVKNKKKNTKNK